jgi:hypothetical protein
MPREETDPLRMICPKNRNRVVRGPVMENNDETTIAEPLWLGHACDLAVMEEPRLIGISEVSALVREHII